jgi:two-component sensor histidine kinase
MYDAVAAYLELNEAEIAFLQNIEKQMSIMADLSRADILLYGRHEMLNSTIMAHAQPHSIAHVYSKSQVGRKVKLTESRQDIIKRALVAGQQKEQGGYISEGAPVVKKTFPIYYPPLACNQNGKQDGQSRVIAAMVVVTNLLEHERQRLRSKIFRKAVKKLQKMVWYGELKGADNLSPFAEQDGIIFVDSAGIVRYASGVASNLYRKLGYKDTLVDRPLSDMETADEELRKQAIAQNQCIENETEEADRIWIRKIIPLETYSSPYWHLPFIKRNVSPKHYGVIIALHDDTDNRRQDQEIQIKNAMIQEVHHRVKNNLQTIAGLIRMQSRRTESDEARAVLTETQQRILSIAVIHEFLSNESSNIINVKEVCQKIVTQLQYGVLSAEQNIQFDVSGDKISIPPRQATACSLILNEILQNAIEHGFANETEGLIQINLEDTGDEAIISVVDNGHGVSDDFDVETNQNLGLQIVRTLVENDLKGQIELQNSNNTDKGLSVTITFPKTVGG